MKNKNISKPLLFALLTLAGLAGVFVLRSRPPLPATSPQKPRPPAATAVKQPSPAKLHTPSDVSSKATKPATSSTAPSPSPAPKTKPGTAKAVAAATPAAAAPVPAAPLKAPPKTPPERASSILNAAPFDEKPYYVQSMPNDPLSPQWFTNTIEADQAWDVTSSRSVVIAVIDTGFALNHEEFVSRWAINAGEQGTTSPGGRCWTGTPANKQTNDCDDDNNGYADDWRGWDFNDDTNNPQAGKENPNGSGVTHGTNVTGLAAATGNNAKGIAGLNWNAKIMPLKAMSDNGSGFTSNIVAAIQYAVDNGANVINLSLGGPSYDAAMATAAAYAESHGVTVVAAAGNCGSSSTGSCAGAQPPGNMLYPALYPTVIAVGALTSSNIRASFSSYGASLDISAPGASITYTPTWTPGNPTGAYAGGLNGTSFSSPIVAGVVSLMQANYPGMLPYQVRDMLADSADKVSSMGGQMATSEYGYGRVNAFKAVADAAARAALLSKGGGSAPAKNAAPTVHAAFGQAGGRAAKASDYLPVYCLSRPGGPCTVTITNQANGTTRTYSSLKTDAGGVAFIVADPLPAGTYSAMANDDQLASSPETIIVQ